jgi:soluble lytic murein transglycosylase-like protein
MNKLFCTALFLSQVLSCLAQSPQLALRREAEYYVSAYARHYKVPVALVRAIVEEESNWRPCAISPKGAVGLMQLIPVTAERLGVRDPCNVSDNVAGGVRYLAWLKKKFASDLRLVAAAYLTGEEAIARRGLLYRNRDVVAYVSRIRKSCERQIAEGYGHVPASPGSRVIR